MEQKKQLDPLPDSGNDIWEYAEKHENIVPQLVNNTGEHYFIRLSGREAKCTHCDWGFALDAGDKIKDGHLYDRSGKLVI